MSPTAAPVTPPVVHAGPFSCSPLDTIHGVPLGSLEWDYVDGHVTLALDDYLVLYTDGVTEARRDGELFDEERLIATVCRLRQSAARRWPRACSTPSPASPASSRTTSSCSPSGSDRTEPHLADVLQHPDLSAIF